MENRSAPPRPTRAKGVGRAAMIAAFLPLCWLAMQVVHEAGHVLVAWGTGGTVTAVVLHPLAISRTDVDPNSSPLAVVWGGPLFGIAAPVVTWLFARRQRRPSAFLWRFFAGFCLVANGAYLGSGVIDPVGDAADLIRLGTPAWLLAAFGLVTVPAGLALWHGQAKHFGFGANAQSPSTRLVWTVLALLVGLIAAELAWSFGTRFR